MKLYFVLAYSTAACSTVELPPPDVGQGGASGASVSATGSGGTTSSTSSTGGNDAGPCVSCMGYLAAWKAGENHSFVDACSNSYAALQGVKACLCDSLGTCSMACSARCSGLGGPVTTESICGWCSSIGEGSPCEEALQLCSTASKQ